MTKPTPAGPPVRLSNLIPDPRFSHAVVQLADNRHQRSTEDMVFLGWVIESAEEGDTVEPVLLAQGTHAYTPRQIRGLDMECQVLKLVRVVQ